MKADRQGGYISGTFLSLIVTIMLLVGTLAFGGWAFISRQDYKNNSDQKAAAAAEESKKKTEAADAIKYAEESKNPLKTHVGPSQYGSITVLYPKTWSAYVNEGSRSSSPVNNYFHPDVVPNINDKDSSYSLRVEVVQQAYDHVIAGYDSAIKAKRVTVVPYTLPKVPNVVGSRIEGQIDQNTQGIMVVVPMRDMTLEIWTESTDYVADFNNFILPNLTFSP